MKKNNHLINIVLTSTFIGLGILLPYINFGSAEIGRMLLPMHIPVLLCGFICGYKYGFVAGFVTPVLRSTLVGMPVMFPMAITMAFELAAYGLAAGLIFKLFKKVDNEKNRPIILYIALVGSLIFGRIIWAIVANSTYRSAGWNFSFEVILNSTLLTAWPGIILQLLVIPPVIFGLMRHREIEQHILSN